MSETPYYLDLLSKLVTNVNGITHDELCCHRLDYRTFENTMEWLINKGYVVEIVINNQKGYKSTYEGNMHVVEQAKKNRERAEAARDPNSIREILDKLNSCWIPVEKLLPENATELQICNIACGEFMTVIVRNDVGHVAIANRIRRLVTGSDYLDKSIDTLEWHWSELSFEPTFWMPMPS